MTDPTRPPFEPPGPTVAGRFGAPVATAARPVAVAVLVECPSPCGAPLLAALEAGGADVVSLDHGGADDDADEVAARLSLLAGRAVGNPRAAERIAPLARSLIARRRASHGSTPLVLAGERLAVTLPLWRSVVDEALPGAFLVAGAPPGDVADGRHAAHVERRWRALLGDLDGARVYVALNPERVLPSDLAAFLGLGTPAARGRGDHGDGNHRASSRSAHQLDGVLRGLAGAHSRLSCPPLPRESPLASAVATAEEDAKSLAGGLSWAADRLEPLLGASVPPGLEAAPTGQRPLGEPLEPTPEGPYPLNASEDRPAYHRWLESRRLATTVGDPSVVPRQATATRPPRHGQPLVSVVVPVWRTPPWALERCVGSVLAQDFPHWQLCLCDDASGDATLADRLAAFARLDRRIEVTALAEPGGISAATNRALALARGELVAFLDHDDELAPHALRLVADAVAAHPDADVIYSDEDKIDATGERFDPFFKPGWSPDLLLSYAYLAHLMVVRRRLVEELGGLRSAYDGSQDWDLALRATERARHVVHVPDVLYHWRVVATSAASGSEAKPWAYEAGRRVLEDALARQGGGEVLMSDRFPGRYHLRRHLASRPLVSAVIPFRDEPALLATCATSLRDAPGYDRFELVLVDNGSELPETAELVERLASQPNIRVVPAPGPFNWAAINNAAAREAGGDLLLFANNDIEARRPGWLHALVGQAIRPEVGAVGARLLYPDGTVQHAGVVIGLGGVAGHVLRGLPADLPGYASMAVQTRDCSVVTGACMMVRKDVFESVGGFDEELPVAFNDVDFCLKLRGMGYLVVYEPLAELVHHESRSRGHTDDLAEGRRIVDRWAGAIAAGDPYLNPNLSHWRYWCPLSNPQEDYRWTIYLEKSLSTPRSSSIT